ncbi:DUF3899 domain-containing protein [Jeotgalibacillus terrae]|uniref:DUF3899 domain-containing protein n=1 Tax=Jeotgalibacillus terrae TaxID=587735 RepID=A0ABW5ZHF4_9BACL|nr:DUF3899 domain-containing protein [Jeotgalibacillus terrae]MBM7580308.1 hypothetical protein [Jeotgalibacillus terrae]
MKYTVLFVFLGYLFYGIVLLSGNAEPGLESFIDASFYISFIYLFIAVTFYILSTGFFDITTDSLRKVLMIGKKMTKEEVEDMRSLSDAASYFNTKPLLFAGIITFMLMGIGLFLYY